VALEAEVSTAATLPRSRGAADGKSVVPAAAVELFGMVGASNVANATKEFKPAQSFHLFGRFSAASGVN
jgi:hypothetical protein